MVDGLVCDFLGWSCGRAAGFLGISVGFSDFLWDARFFLPFFWISLDFFSPVFWGLRSSEPWGWL